VSDDYGRTDCDCDGDDRIRSLTECLDALLLSPAASGDRIALPWLHLLSRHPVQMLKYRNILHRLGSSALPEAEEGRGWNPGPAYVAAATLRRLVHSAAPSRCGWREWLLNLRASAPYDVLLLSVLVRAAHLEDETDFYFGDLQQRFAGRGLRSLLIMRNASGEPDHRLAPRALRSGASARVLLPQVLGLREETAFIRRAIQVRREIREGELSRGGAVEREVLHEARLMALSPAMIANLRVRAQIRRIAELTRPRIAITLYEGHAVERCIWDAVRSVAEDTLCVGYQHATIWPHTHVMRRSLGHSGRYDPDLLLTLGEVTRAELAESPDLATVPLVSYGSHRRTGEPGDSSAARQRRAVLVTPEGYASESVQLFRLAVVCARLLPGLTFILRTHPVLPFDAIRDKVPGWDLPNVEISAGRTLEDDLARSGACVYRGSSTVLQAILGGLRPFHFMQPGEVILDPVHRLDSWRVVVSSEEQLMKGLQAHFDFSGDGDCGFEEARRFCSRYVLPLQEDALDLVLDVAPPRSG
jgi:hypothetical protein